VTGRGGLRKGARTMQAQKGLVVVHVPRSLKGGQKINPDNTYLAIKRTIPLHWDLLKLDGEGGSYREKGYRVRGNQGEFLATGRTSPGLGFLSPGYRH